MTVETTILEQRRAYNRAIAGRDLAAIEHLLRPDYVVLPGSKGTAQSRESLIDLLSTHFRDPTFGTYVRTATQVRLSGSSRRVAETGRWTGSWRKRDGLMLLSGVYQAVWVRDGDQWRLINESFVTLRCSGSAECTEVD